MSPPCKFPIEVPYAIAIFGFMLSESISTNWMMYRTCYTLLAFNESDCALLGYGNYSNSTSEMEKNVQPFVTVISMARSIAQAALAAIACCFLGPWSDKYGRKPVLLLSLAGYGVAYSILAATSAIPNLSPWYVLLIVLPVGITGGFIAQVSAVICYITDSTTVTHRGIRLAIFEAATTGGYLLGSISSSFILTMCGYTIVFIISVCCYLAAWLIILFFVPESIRNIETNGRFRNIFQIVLLKKSFNVTFKKRSGFQRALLLTVMLILLIYVFTFTASSLGFLYLRETFKWSLEQFTIFSGSSTVTGIIGCMLGIYVLHTLFHFNESFLMLLGLLSSLSAALVVAFATNNWYIYASGGVNFFSGCISPMARSLISKIVLEDCGTVFSFLAVCESIASLVAGFLYTDVYNKTLLTFPAAIYFITAGLCIIAIILNIVVIVIQKRKNSVAEYRVFENLDE